MVITVQVAREARCVHDYDKFLICRSCGFSVPDNLRQRIAEVERITEKQEPDKNRDTFDPTQYRSLFPSTKIVKITKSVGSRWRACETCHEIFTSPYGVSTTNSKRHYRCIPCAIRVGLIERIRREDESQ